MSDGPNAWNMVDIAKQFQTGNGCWTDHPEEPGAIPARPLGPTWLSHRWRLAWDVWMGRADALYWPARARQGRP